MAISNDNVAYPTDGTAKRTALGSFVNFLAQGVAVAEHILFVPLFLWAWGSALYGEWLTLFSLIAYFSLANVGMGNFVINRMTQHYSRGDIENYVRTFKSAFSLYMVIVGVLSVFLLIFAFGAPFFDWFDLSIASETSVRAAVLILGAYILWGVLFELVANLYVSIGEFVRYQIITSIKEILLIGFIALTLFFGGGFISVASWYLVFLFVFAFFVFLDVKRRYPQIIFKSAKTDWKLGISFLVPGLVFLLIPLAEVIKIQGSVLLVSSSLGAVAVVIFSVHRTLAHLVHRLTGALHQALRPELAADEARGNYEKIRLIYNFLSKIVFLVSVSTVVFLFFTGEDIIGVWTSGKIEFQPALWWLFLGGLLITTLWTFNGVFQTATNKYTGYSVSRLVSALIGLVLAFVLVESLGMMGVLLGFILGEVAVNLWFVPYRTIKIIRGSVKKFLFMMFKGLPMLVFQLPLVWALNEYITNVWLRLIMIGITAFVVGSAFTYFVWMDRGERKMTSGLLKNYIPATLKS